jgi:aminobenzoyl-glutamate transport protein
MNLSVAHPATGKEITVVNLLSAEGLRRILTSLVNNFTSFAPLGTVLVTILGVGVAEGSGMLAAMLRMLVLSAPKRLITAVVVFAGIMSNAASDAGYIILIPLGGLIFLAFGRHPLAGIAAAFAGVSGGFSANLLLGTIDPLLAGITQEMSHIIDPTYSVNAAANYYFMFVSTFLLTFVGTFVTERIVETRLGKYEGEATTLDSLTSVERRGLKIAAVTTLTFCAVLALLVVPDGAPLRDPKTGGLLHSPFLNGIVGITLAFFFVPGVAYGLATKVVKSDNDVISFMNKAASSMGSYIVLVFFAAQFVAFFNWTNLGLITAVEGAQALKATGFTGIPLIIAFVLVTATINLVIGSASAKWAIMAPIFVPMFMLLGYSPELTQAAYRVGDSVSNVISPMMSYLALIIAFVKKYKPDAGIGTIVAMMLPYTISFMILWTIMLVGWIAAELPLGPGAALTYPTSE